MKLPRLDFTSYRDSKGYRIAGTVPPRGRGRLSFHELMNTPVKNFLEADYLDNVVDDGAGDGPWISGYIVALGGKAQKVPLKQYPDAFEKFAAVKTPIELLEFVRKFGLLTNAKRQHVLKLLDEANQMRECMQADKALFFRNLDLKAHFIKDHKTGKLEASITPSSLLDALWWQFQQSQSSSAEFRKCPHCDTYFAVGGNSGRLRTAEFCSPEHRKRFNSLARSNPDLRKKRLTLRKKRS